MTRATLAFDVYGTLIDPLGIAAEVESYIGDRAAEFASLWRDKQIEYLYRRALMRDYVDFPTCTRQALRYADARLGTGLSAKAQDALIARYVELPAYEDASAALLGLRAAGYACFAFSNGHPDDLGRLLRNAGLGEHLDGVVSVHEVRSFKPDPAVYTHFLTIAGATAGDTWLISGNPFDVIGALRCGWAAAWVRRDKSAVFDPWGIEPTVTVADLSLLRDELRE